MMFNNRNLRPSTGLSQIKSILQLWLMLGGTDKGCLIRSGTRFPGFTPNIQPKQRIHPFQAFVVTTMTAPTKAVIIFPKPNCGVLFNQGMQGIISKNHIILLDLLRYPTVDLGRSTIFTGLPPTDSVPFLSIPFHLSIPSFHFLPSFHLSFLPRWSIPSFHYPFHSELALWG